MSDLPVVIENSRHLLFYSFAFLASNVKVLISIKWVDGQTHVEKYMGGFMLWACTWHTSLPLTLHCLKLSSVATHNCKEGWEILSSTCVPKKKGKWLMKKTASICHCMALKTFLVMFRNK